MRARVRARVRVSVWVRVAALVRVRVAALVPTAKWREACLGHPAGGGDRE